MKKIRKVSVLVLSVLLLIACSTNDDSDTNDGVNFKLEIDGVLYQASALEAGIGNENKYFELASINGNSESFQFRFGELNETTAQQIETGLVLSTNSGDSITMIYQNQETEFIAGGDAFNGQVTITNIDYDNNVISGTFSGMIYNPDYSPGEETGEEEFIELTNGIFTNLSFTTN